MRPSWIWAPRPRAVSRCSRPPPAHPGRRRAGPETTWTTTAGRPHTSASSTAQAGLGLVPTAELVQEPGGQAVEEQGRDLHARRRGRSRRRDGRARPSRRPGRARRAGARGGRRCRPRRPRRRCARPAPGRGAARRCRRRCRPAPRAPRRGHGGRGPRRRASPTSRAMATASSAQRRASSGVPPALEGVGVGGQHPGPGRGGRLGGTSRTASLVLVQRPRRSRPARQRNHARRSCSSPAAVGSASASISARAVVDQLDGASEGAGAAGGVRGAQEDVAALQSLPTVGVGPAGAESAPVRPSPPPARALQSHSSSASS